MKSLSKRKKVDSDFSHAAKMEEEHVKMRDKMEETVSVTWNHFEETAVGAFKSLEEDTHFTDVTLACGDGQVLFSSTGSLTWSLSGWDECGTCIASRLASLFHFISTFFQHSLRSRLIRRFLSAVANFSSKF